MAERVLRSRLSDAKFFWDQDRKQRLEERLPALKDDAQSFCVRLTRDLVRLLEERTGEKDVEDRDGNLPELAAGSSTLRRRSHQG